MDRDRRTALISLAAAGALWGLTVPLSKLALGWLDGAWLAVARFGVAAPLLAFVARRELRAALSGPVAAWGALGYGLVIVLQNAGIARTSVSHGSLIVDAVPALVALISLVRGRARIGRRSWLGFALALAGVAFVAGGGGPRAPPARGAPGAGPAPLSAPPPLPPPPPPARRGPRAGPPPPGGGRAPAVLPLAPPA